MIKLKNVSKFYYSKGIIATGFTKVNLEFNIGEFVAIVPIANASAISNKYCGKIANPDIITY